MRIERTARFKRDFKVYKKKNYQMEKLKSAIACILEKDVDTLKTKYKDHALIGNWQGYRELHIESDWLLIYKIEQENLVLVLVRTGSHDQLF